jgi:hypothetical protein
MALPLRLTRKAPGLTERAQLTEVARLTDASQRGWLCEIGRQSCGGKGRRELFHTWPAPAHRPGPVSNAPCRIWVWRVQIGRLSSGTRRGGL